MSAEYREAFSAQFREVGRYPIPSAFSVEELDTLQAWVERGGGLFLVFDIFQTPGAIEALVGRFGVEVSNGFAVDERLLPALRRETRSPLGQRRHHVRGQGRCVSLAATTRKGLRLSSVARVLV